MEPKPKPEVYKMSLHETICLGRLNNVMRVPGGWIYHFNNGANHATSTFVPYSTEFLEGVF